MQTSENAEWFSYDFPGLQMRLEFDYSDDNTSVDKVIAVKFGELTLLLQPHAN